MRSLLSFLFAAVLLAACASSHPAADGPRAHAAAFFPDTSGVRYAPNVPASHLLVWRTEAKTPQQPLAVTSYFIYDLADTRVVMEESAVRGTVRWADAYHVRVDVVPGMVSRDPDTNARNAAYLVDARTGARAEAGK